MCEKEGRNEWEGTRGEEQAGGKIASKCHAFRSLPLNSPLAMAYICLLKALCNAYMRHTQNLIDFLISMIGKVYTANLMFQL